MQLEEFRALLETAALRKNGKPYFTTTIEQSSIVVEKMFAYATSNVRILTGMMNARIYGVHEVILQAKTFLQNPDHRVDVLMEDYTPNLRTEHPLLHTFSAYSNVSLRNVPARAVTSYTSHFLLVDGQSYRYARNRSANTAVFAFGDGKGGANLDELFSQIWQESAPVELHMKAA